jgi:hypothetical protein
MRKRMWGETGDEGAKKTYDARAIRARARARTYRAKAEGGGAETGWPERNG